MDTSVVEPSQIFSQWAQQAAAAPNRWSELSASISWAITDDKSQRWIFDSSRLPMLEPAKPGQAASCQLEMSYEQFMQLVRGEKDPQTAFLDGELRVAGTLDSALQCTVLFDILFSKEQSS